MADVTRYTAMTDGLDNPIVVPHPAGEVVLYTAYELRVKELEEALEAADRLFKDNYIPWALAGGPEECSHKVSTAINCEKCDLAKFRAALAEKGNADGQ